MASDSFKIKKSLSVESGGTLNSSGDVGVSSNKLRFHNGTTASDVVTASHTETLTNKTIDADSNTVSNIEDADIKAAAAIARSKLANGTADHVVINSGAGAFSSEAQLAISRGGTGQSTASSAINALVPTQTGNNGKFLTTNGTAVSWDTAPSAPTFVGSRARGQSGGFTVADATETIVSSYDSVDWNISSYFNNANGRYTPLEEGYYLVSFAFIFSANATGIRYAVVNKNGTAEFFGTDIAANASAISVHGSGVVHCNGSTDYIEVAIFQSSGGNLGLDTVASSTMVSFTKLGAT